MHSACDLGKSQAGTLPRMAKYPRCCICRPEYPVISRHGWDDPHQQARREGVEMFCATSPLWNDDACMGPSSSSEYHHRYLPTCACWWLDPRMQGRQRCHTIFSPLPPSFCETFLGRSVISPGMPQLVRFLMPSRPSKPKWVRVMPVIHHFQDK